jgi:hypothetical protein
MLRKNAAKKYAYDLVIDKKYCYHQLDQDEREKLTGLIMQSTPLNYLYDYIADADMKSEVPCMLSKLLENNDVNLRYDIVELLKNNACTYASNQIDALLEEALEDYNFDKKYESGTI